MPITVPATVTVDIEGRNIKVTGPKGTLAREVVPEVRMHLEDGQLLVTRPSDQPRDRAMHGLTRALLANMVEGVVNGYKKSLEIQGVGYRAAKSGEKLNLTLGYSHPVSYEPPKGIALSVEGTNKVHVEGIDKQQVGQVAAEIRNLRPPEPYKGKGVRYAGEIVRKKLGKAGKAGKK